MNRPTGLSGALGSNTSTYIASAGYASNDALNQLTLGPSTISPFGPIGTQSITFDPVRQQPTTITVANPSATQLTLHYFYCPSSGTSCSTNNGNVQSAGIAIPGLTLTQTFSYDTVNRLTSAQETGGADEWNQAYGHDQWGNRAVSGNYIPNAYATPTSLSQYTNNQWLGTGASYDSKGNQLNLPLRISTYDAENRLVASTQPGTGAISYVYDGDGRRIQKTVGSAVTNYVYDSGGQLAAEYGTSATFAGTDYLMADALGSTRVVLDATGSVKERIDYLPFGEEIATPVGGRAAPYTAGLYPSNPDIEAQKFTGKERDAEAGLDHSWFRYSSAAQGRWSSADPFGGQISDPQMLNRYAYVRNNPLGFVDPLGLRLVCETQGRSDQPVCYDNGQPYIEPLPAGQTPDQAGSTQTFAPTLVPRSNDVPLNDTAQQVFSQTGGNLRQFWPFMATFAGGAALAGAASVPAVGSAISSGARFALDRVAFGPAAGRVFWSGAGAQMAGRLGALGFGGSTLEMTRLGRVLDFFTQAALGNGVSWDRVRPFWVATSGAFASGAQGSVLFYQGLSVSPSGIWMTQELPILVNSGILVVPITR